MSASSQTALRPMLPEDVPVLAAIFAASIEGLTADDYDDDQQAAWIATADDEAQFGARLRNQLTLVATHDGAPVGFASLKGKDNIDLVYVHPNAARQGVASALIDALERLAGARGATTLMVNASDTAEPFFAKRDYQATQRNSVSLDGEWLANTSMTKKLAGPKP